MAEPRKARKVNADAMDRSKMGVAKPVAARTVAEVEGQQGHADPFSMTCPYCGQVVAEETNSAQYQWFTCGVCGGAFQA